jgi:rhamnose transport system substrate-binding protein
MRRLIPLLLAGLAATLIGCSNPSSSSGGPGGDGSLPGGGSSSSSSDLAPKTGTIKLGMMPKKKGIPYFNACQLGAEEAAKELGDIDLTYDGPTEDKSERQSEILETWITQKFDAIAVACNDPEQISNVLESAHSQGIFPITWDADANAELSKRLFFVNQAGAEDLAHKLVDVMVEQVGETAEVAVVSSSPTAPNQSAWLKIMDAYLKDKHPGIKIVTTEFAEENQVLSEQKAQSILKAHPNVKGIWGMTSVAFPGTASAVEKAGKAGQVAVVGLGTPKEMKPFVDRGVVEKVVLWNPIDLGYLTVHVARAAAKGELKAGATTFKAGRLGEKKVDGQQVLLGEPMVFDKANIGNFHF